MSQHSSMTRDLASRLIALERKGRKHPAHFLAVEKLRPQLVTLMGAGGYHALLARALALSGEEAAWLRDVPMQTDGSLEGWAKLAAKIDAKKLAEGRIILAAQVLGLLTAFIGETLTLRLVRETWPKLSLTDLNTSKGAKS